MNILFLVLLLIFQNVLTTFNEIDFVVQYENIF